MLVPSLLRRVERSRVGIALGFEVVNGVDGIRRVSITDSDHDRILIRTHDVGDAV